MQGLIFCLKEYEIAFLSRSMMNRSLAMNIEQNEACYIVLSSTDYSTIKTIMQEFEDTGRYNNAKHRFIESGIGIGFGEFPLGINKAIHSSIKDGLTDDTYGYTIDKSNQSIWYISAIYENGSISNVSDINSIKTGMDIDIHISYSLDKDYNRVEVNSTKYKVSVKDA